MAVRNAIIGILERISGQNTSAPDADKAVHKLAQNEMDSRKCGLRDARLSGWFDGEAGLLANGFDIRPTDVVIDVGCGEGGAVGFALRQGAAKVFACDIDSSAIAEVDKKFSDKYGDRLKTIVTDSKPLPIEQETATRIIAMEVLEHVDEPQQFLAELVRVAKPGSLFLLTVPDMAGELVQKKIAPPSYWEKPNHLRIFSREDFVGTVEEAGLVVERQFTYGFYWSIWWSLFWAAEKPLEGAHESPLLQQWTRTWSALLNSPKGGHIRDALNDAMPKSQCIVARKL